MTVRAPAPYDDVGATETNKKLQRCFQRFFKASGLWPHDWLPLDYKPRPPAFGQNAAESLVVVVEAVCSPGSGVTMDELREFLVNKVKERQSKRKPGKPPPLRMKADCEAALNWVKSKSIRVSPSSTSRYSDDVQETLRARMVAENEANAVYDSILQDGEEMEEPVGEELGEEVARNGQQSNTSETSHRGTSFEDAISISDTATEPSSVDGEDMQTEAFLSMIEETTNKRKRSSADSPGVTKRSRHAEIFDHPDTGGGVESAGALDGGMHTDQDSNTSQNDAVSLRTIDRDMRALESRIQDDTRAINKIVQLRDEQKELFNSLDIPSADEALLEATRNVDKAQEAFNQVQNLATKIDALIQEHSEHCAALMGDQYNNFLSSCNEAERQRNRAEDYLEEKRRAKESIESLRREKLENIASLEEKIRACEKRISKETQKQKVLLTQRTLLGIVGSENLHVVAELDDLHKLGSRILDKVRDLPSKLPVPERS